MSRILLISDDPRKVPPEACWWRLRLPRNPDGSGTLCMSQYDIPENRQPWDGQWMPWSGSIEYYDRRDDWTFPHRHSVNIETIEEGPWLDCDRTIVVNRKHYLDVLAITPPDMSDYSRWGQLTEPGDWSHPGNQRPWNKKTWPLAKPFWIQPPLYSCRDLREYV